jgi:hypothetical protein
MARASLPDPDWTDAAIACTGCGYSLRGLPVPGRCPECGHGYEARQLILAGIPAAIAPGSPMRGIAWAAIITLGVVQAYTTMLQVAFLHWTVPLGLVTLIVGAVVAMLLTGPRERRGTERFCITPAGLARLPAHFDPASARFDNAMIPWSSCDAVDLKRISPVWRRLRIGRAAPNGKLTDVRFQAGIRCPDAAADIVLSTIRQYLAPPTPGPLPPHPPTSPPSRSPA